MKKALFTAVVFFVWLVPVFAQSKTDVHLRFGKQTGVLRLVFEAEESFIKKTNVSLSGLQIHVEFPSDFNIIPQKGFDLQTSIKDRTFIINLKEQSEMKILRLLSPARLVVDMFAPKAVMDIKSLMELPLPQKVFVIDPGHGGYDFGIVSNDMKEKDIALAIAKELESLLIKKGKTVFLTKKSDQFMPLTERAVFANQKVPEIFISIHVSASESFAVYMPKIDEKSPEPSEDELYGLRFRQKNHVNKSRSLAENIGKAIKEEFALNVIYREMNLPILDSVNTPAVLIEVPSFRAMSYDPKTRMRVAEGIIKGLSYYGQ
ncbi:MAG: N-acetylmuramoyl-L-alanine amidase [Nitrospirae bacterium]|nr:N-acetylmuramoyl-L-alanine amidase [Nitrospirota bacterium]